MRYVLNAAYAYLAEQAEHADAVAEPTFQAKGIKQEDIQSASRRTALDAWLDAPMAAEAKRDNVLLTYLGGVG